MNRDDNSLKKAFETLDKEGFPSDEQKDIMLDRIKLQCKAGNATKLDKLRGFVVVCPWRIAIAVSAVQAAVLTLVFGTGYTNILLGAIGG